MEFQNFIDCGPPLVTKLAARWTTTRLIKLNRSMITLEVELHDLVFRRLCRYLALSTKRSKQPLRQNHFYGRRDQGRLYSHVDEPGDCGGCIVRMQGREDEVSGECRPNRDFCRFRVPDLPHHDHIRIL